MSSNTKTIVIPIKSYHPHEFYEKQHYAIQLADEGYVLSCYRWSSFHDCMVEEYVKVSNSRPLDSPVSN